MLVPAIVTDPRRPKGMQSAKVITAIADLASLLKEWVLYLFHLNKLSEAVSVIIAF